MLVLKGAKGDQNLSIAEKYESATVLRANSQVSSYSYHLDTHKEGKVKVYSGSYYMYSQR